MEKYYDEQYDEWARLERHAIEFDITKRYLDEYITGESLRVIDIGGGPGRYAIYLAQRGHEVTLVDLSRRNIEDARVKTGELGIKLKDYIVADILDFDPPGTFDCALLMGPLYHLLTEGERKRAVEKTLSALRPGGVIVASFISNYAPLVDTLQHMYPIKGAGDLLGYLEDGVNSAQGGFTTAYFSSRAEAQGLMNGFGLEQLAFVGVENILTIKEAELMALEAAEYEKWLEIGYALSRDEKVMDVSQHYLYIGKKR